MNMNGVIFVSTAQIISELAKSSRSNTPYSDVIS